MKLKEADKRKILFDPVKHKYTDEQGNHYISVTQLLSSVKPKFDKEYWLLYKLLEKELGRIKPLVEIRSYKIDNEVLTFEHAQQIIKDNDKKNLTNHWKELTDVACEVGSKEHNYLEDSIDLFYTGGNSTGNVAPTMIDDLLYKDKIVNQSELEATDLKNTYPSIFKLLYKLIGEGWTIYTEYRVYSPIHLIAGTIDLLLIKGDTFRIIDWKTNKHEIIFKSGYYKKEWVAGEKIQTNKFIRTDDRFLAPINDLPLCKGFEYSLQINMYAYILQLWGLKYDRALICHIRSNYKETNFIGFDEPLFYQVPNLQTSINKIFTKRLKDVKVRI